MAISEPKEIKAVLAELESANPRAAILVGAALLDYTLEQAILSKLPAAFANPGSVFARGGMFHDLENKILGAYFLGIVGPKRRSDLDIIRRIRNDCAHNPNAIDFDTDPTASRVRSLDFPPIESLREQTLASKYKTAVGVISGALLAKGSGIAEEAGEAMYRLALDP